MKKYLQFSADFLTIFFILALVTPVMAQGTSAWGGVCVENDVATIRGVQCLLANILSVAITLIGFTSFVMLLIGAFRYMLSGGNSKGVESARNTITYAIFGVVVALSSFIILNLLSAFTGVEEIKTFNIPDNNARPADVGPLQPAAN